MQRWNLFRADLLDKREKRVNIFTCKGGNAYSLMAMKKVSVALHLELMTFIGF